MDSDDWERLIADFGSAVSVLASKELRFVEQMHLDRSSRCGVMERRALLEVQKIARGEGGRFECPPAFDAQIDRAERRLGVALPPGYKAFLRTSNGFAQPWPLIGSLQAIEQVRWFGEVNAELVAIIREAYIHYPSVPESLVGTMLQITSRPVVDDSYYLLDPSTVSLNGECRAYLLQQYELHAFESFQQLLEAQTEAFRYLAR